MFYRLKKDTYVRNYDGIGYITSTGIVNASVVNGTGAVLLSLLNRQPQSLDELVNKAEKIFDSANHMIIYKDAK